MATFKMKVTSSRVEGFEGLRVSDLIRWTNFAREWDLELVESLFMEEEAKLVASIPLIDYLV